MGRVGEIVTQVPFPLVVIHPRHWRGPAFLGDVQRRDGRLEGVGFVYQDLDATRGAAVINAPADVETADDIARFAARFDPRFVRRRTKRRGPVFPPEAFASMQVRLTVLDLARTVQIRAHVDAPLEVARVAVSDVSNAWVCGWDTGVRDLLPLLEPLDPEMVARFDDGGEPYPPPGWVASEEE